MRVKKMFSEKIRKWGFDFIDVCKGRSVLKNKEEIRYLFHHKDKVPQFQQAKFQALANWAVNNTVFYASVKNDGAYKLSDFPIIDKNIIKENHTAFCTVKVKEKGAIQMHTSGSTGTPLVIIQDKKKENVYMQK